MVVPLPRSNAGVDDDVMAEDIVVGEARWVHEAWDVCGCDVRCARKARTHAVKTSRHLKIAACLRVVAAYRRVRVQHTSGACCRAPAS